LTVLRAEEYRERRVDVAGSPVNLTSYRLDKKFHCKADNVSPGSGLARTTGATREEAEARAITRAEELLSRTKRRAAEA
jgi:hypothetical protein